MKKSRSEKKRKRKPPPERSSNSGSPAPVPPPQPHLLSFPEAEARAHRLRLWAWGARIFWLVMGCLGTAALFFLLPDRIRWAAVLWLAMCLVLAWTTFETHTALAAIFTALAGLDPTRNRGKNQQEERDD